MKVPSFLLKKLYVKGSLKNTEDGFEFTIKNVLMDGTITAPIDLTVDNRLLPQETITITAQGTSRLVTEISEADPAPLKVDVEVVVAVKGKNLAPGEHELEVAAVTKEYGDIRFSIKDSL